MYCYDFYIEHPHQNLNTFQNKPYLEKGASKPKPPPPAMAPYEEVQGSADTSFSKIAQGRKGLRSTILSQPTLNQSAEATVGNAATLGQPPVALGTRAPVPPSMVSASTPPARTPQTQIQTMLAGATNKKLV